MVLIRNGLIFFGSLRPNNEIHSISPKKLILISERMRHYVHDVTFTDLTQRAIYYYNASSEQTTLLVERAFFKNNKNSSNGANIYFYYTGQCVQSKCCCTNCSSGSNGIHSYVQVTNNQNYKNFIHQSSFTNLVSSVSSVFYVLCGLAQVNQTNITNCKDSHNSCFYYNSVMNNSMISSSNFKNNTSTSNQGITIHTANNPYVAKILQCNIIEQHCGVGNGIICVYCYTRIESCVIKDNIADDNYLFYIRNGNGIYVTNSYVNNLDAPYFTGGVPTITNSLTNENELNLPLYTTANCKGTYIQKDDFSNLKFADYTKFAAKFCESFNMKYNNNLLCMSASDSFFILFSDML